MHGREKLLHTYLSHPKSYISLYILPHLGYESHYCLCVLCGIKEISYVWKCVREGTGGGMYCRDDGSMQEEALWEG